MQKRYGIVYKITNLINNKVYIGVTTRTFKKRYKGNLARVTHNEHMRSSIKKYGIENFRIEEEFDIAYSMEELNEKEQYYIKLYNSTNPKKGYNKVTGGQWGYVYSREARLNLRRANTQKKVVYQYTLEGEFVKQYIPLTSVRDFGYCHKTVNDCCLNKTKTSFGYFWSYQQLSKQQVIDKVNTDTRTNTVTVYQYTSDGKFIKKYSAIHDAGRELNIMPQNISHVCNGKRKHCGGFKWSYIPLHEEAV